MAAKRIYKVVNAKDQSVALVEASSPAMARNHCARNQYAVSLPTTREVADLVVAGTKVETAGEASE